MNTNGTPVRASHMREHYDREKWEGDEVFSKKSETCASTFVASEPPLRVVTPVTATDTDYAKKSKENVNVSGGGADDFTRRVVEPDLCVRAKDDFFTDPISKLVLHGRFPFKLAVNCLMLLFIFLIALLYHTPGSIANEVQRKAVLKHFLGDDYLGKDKGDIVSQPTLYLSSRQDVLDHIRDFVKVYYELSSTSISELKYYYYTHAYEDAENLYKLFPGESPQRLDELHSLLLQDDSEDNDDILNLSWVRSVLMDLHVFLYSLQEHHSRSPSRHFTFELTEDDQLGPFKNDENVQVSEDESDVKVRPLTQKNIHNNSHRHLDRIRGSITRPSLGSTKNVIQNDRSSIAAACAPRLDLISMHYYDPCRGAAKDSVEQFSPLLGNAQTIRLRAALRHFSNSDHAKSEFDVCGFSAIIYHWTVEKTFFFHLGGLVEVTFSATATTHYMHPKLHARFFLSAALLLLVCIDVVLRIRVMTRIRAWRKSIAARRQQNDRMESQQTCGPEANGCSTLNSSADIITNKHIGSMLHSRVQEMVIEADNENDNKHNSASSQPTPIITYLSQLMSKSPVNKKASLNHKAGTLMTETTYMDFQDIWRQMLQQSQSKGWQYIAFFTDMVVTVYAILSLCKLGGMPSTELYEVIESIFLGFSGLLICIGFLSYLRYFPQVYFTVWATRQVIPRLLAFVATVAPFFLGFSFFFFIMFGPHSKGEFSDIGFTMVGLYFVMYGDAILPAISDAQGSVYHVVSFLANAMTIIFVLLFMMTMLNLAMSITQHEWGMMRRRFGACLSTGNMLFTVRTREQVKLETTKSLIANLELLLYIRHEEQMMENASVTQSERENVGDLGDGGTEGDASITHMHRSFAEHEVSKFLLYRLDELTEGAFREDP